MAMALYMAQFAYTPEAWTAFTKHPEDRTAAVQALAQKLGCRCEAPPLLPPPVKLSYILTPLPLSLSGVATFVTYRGEMGCRGEMDGLRETADDSEQRALDNSANLDCF
jgi:hypothetical protein